MFRAVYDFMRQLTAERGTMSIDTAVAIAQNDYDDADNRWDRILQACETAKRRCIMTNPLGSYMDDDGKKLFDKIYRDEIRNRDWSLAWDKDVLNVMGEFEKTTEHDDVENGDSSCSLLDAMATDVLIGALARWYDRKEIEADKRKALKEQEEKLRAEFRSQLRSVILNSWNGVEGMQTELAQPRQRKKYNRSKSRDWTQQKAANLLGISTRQLRNYKRNPPDDHWPGWEDPIQLQQWKNQREDRDRMARALSRTIPFRENVTERAMRT